MDQVVTAELNDRELQGRISVETPQVPWHPPILLYIYLGIHISQISLGCNGRGAILSLKLCRFEFCLRLVFKISTVIFIFYSKKTSLWGIEPAPSDYNQKWPSTKPLVTHWFLWNCLIYITYNFGTPTNLLKIRHYIYIYPWFPLKPTFNLNCVF